MLRPPIALAAVLATTCAGTTSGEDALFERLLAGNPWGGLEFVRGSGGEPAARSIARPEEILSVRIDGRDVTIGEKSYRWDSRCEMLLSTDCLRVRLRRSNWTGRWGWFDFVSEDPYVRREGLWSLVEWFDPVDVLLHPWAREEIVALLSDPVPEVRAYAALVMGAFDVGESVEPLRRLLGDSDPIVRRESAEALGRVGDRSDILRLQWMLGDDDPSVRGHAREAMGALRDRWGICAGENRR